MKPSTRDELPPAALTKLSIRQTDHITILADEIYFRGYLIATIHAAGRNLPPSVRAEFIDLLMDRTPWTA